MAAPKGNQYALGQGCPQKYDREKLAESLDKWSLREDADHLGKWALLEEDLPCISYVNRFASESEEFAKAHKKAKLRIALRLRAKLHDKENPYNYGLFMRDISIYDQLLVDTERAEKMFDAELKRQQTNDNHSGDVGKLADAIDRLASKREANPSDSDKQ